MFENYKGEKVNKLSEEPAKTKIERARFWVKQRRRKNYLDRLLIKLFPKTFLRWCDSHLGEAYHVGLLNSEILHNLDSQMKGDLGFKGY